ncbi:MAG: carbohydrate-binding domain-containing protein, partial [Candidatus Promineifilaceae bacterium]
MKAGVALTITGGTITINSADDALHANGTITINGGLFTLASGDDGMHADATLTINDGTIAILTSYEGLEASNVIVNGGTVDIVSSDDGLNGAGGNDTAASESTGFGQDNFSSSQGTITINGGTITIAAAASGNGDGLDANGTITVTGGDTVVKTPSSYRDYSDIDYDTAFSLTGGSVRILNADGTYTQVTDSYVSQGPGGGGRPGRP